jgi:hypothetical protein
MVVNEGFEVAKPDETLPEPVTNAAEETPAPQQQAPVALGPSWLRLAYAFEFLVALIATFVLWGEVGGQGHLDLIPWYTKLVLGLGMTWSAVRFTAGLTEEQHAWNTRTRRWLTALIVIGVAMGGITYYYHLHEAPDQPDSDETTATSVSFAVPRPALSPNSDRTSH